MGHGSSILKDGGEGGGGGGGGGVYDVTTKTYNINVTKFIATFNPNIELLPGHPRNVLSFASLTYRNFSINTTTRINKFFPCYVDDRV